MSDQIKRVRVVLVSPGDVSKERAAAQAVIDELNRAVAGDRGVVLSLWRWETDAYLAMHLDGPQGHIDELMDLQHADIVIGLFWTRFGTPTFDANSGTEHELRRAWSAWSEHGRPQVMVYFCKRPHAPATSVETQQWGRVLDFQRDLPKQQLWWTYTKRREFTDLLREHLTRHVLTEHAAPTPTPTARRGDDDVGDAKPVRADDGRETVDEPAGVEPENPSTEPLAFLCHSSSDKGVVRRLERRLRGDHIRTWFDERELLPGQDWNSEIRKAVRAADVVIVCLSRESVATSGYLQTEIRLVLDVADEQPEGTIFVIPAKITPCNVPERLSRWHWVDLHKRGGYDRLVAAVREAKRLGA